MKFEHPEFICVISKKMKCRFGLAFCVVCLISNCVVCLLQFQIVQKFGHCAPSPVMCICWLSLN